MSNQDTLEEARRAKASSPIEEDIAQIDAQVVALAAAKAKVSVYIHGWGTCYRQENGGWIIPGAGFCGPLTQGARMCEKELRKKGENMDRNQVVQKCWELLGYSSTEPSSPLRDFWSGVIEAFASRNTHLGSEGEVAAAFEPEMALRKKQIQETGEFWSNATQRHHDYFVFLSRQRPLSDGEKEDYNLALQREHEGLCKPLPEDATSPFG